MQFRNISLRGKIISVVVATVFVIGAFNVGSTSLMISRSFDEQALDEVSHASVAVQSAVDDILVTLKRNAVTISKHPGVVDAVARKDAPALQRLARDIMKDAGLDVLTIADAQGNVIARGHSEKTGDSVATQVNVKKALKGEVSAGLEEGSVVKFSARAGAPLLVSGQVVGTVTPGMDLTTTFAFVDNVKKNQNIECTIFKDDERVSTTLQKDGKRLIGTKMDNPKVIETVLRKGEKFFNVNTIQGKRYDTAYWPIMGADGKIAGMFFVGKDLSIVRKMTMNVIWTILGAVLIVGALMTAVGFFVARSIAVPIVRVSQFLMEGAESVSTCSAQVAQASQVLAEGSSEQAASLEETSSSLEELSSMTRNNADNAAQASSLMNEAMKVVERVDGQMKTMTAAINEVTRTSEETGKIVKTIDEIAFQTNLLALNAAVEAARAGEAGAGFAVVADEVRNLAMRAAEAAKDTSALIGETVATVRKSSDLTKQTQAAFQENVNISAKVGSLVHEIAAASSEQAQGIGQISKAVAEMDRVVQMTAASAEESASASHEMNTQAHEIEGHVSELVQTISGKGSRAKTSQVAVV